MSGPKTSRYKLTPAQRRMLIAQRERQRRCGEASAFLASIRTKLCRLKQFPADELERAEILMQRTGEHVYSEKRDELCQRVQEAIEKIDEVKGSNDPALLERTLEQAKQEYERLLNLRGELDGISCEIAAKLRRNRQGVQRGLIRAWLRGGAPLSGTPGCDICQGGAVFLAGAFRTAEAGRHGGSGAPGKAEQRRRAVEFQRADSRAAGEALPGIRAAPQGARRGVRLAHGAVSRALRRTRKESGGCHAGAGSSPAAGNAER